MQAKGNNKKALEYYTQALENSTSKEIEYTLIGTVYYNEDKLEEAIKYYNLAIDANDDYELAYEGRNQSMLENHLQILDMQDSLIKRNMFK
jgi:tetratricopeptide (TPR) repeat protein